ncbi:hypothetical protein SRHO_G00023640 [Serrasalmus rhombeus]
MNYFHWPHSGLKQWFSWGRKKSKEFTPSLYTKHCRSAKTGFFSCSSLEFSTGAPGLMQVYINQISIVQLGVSQPGCPEACCSAHLNIFLASTHLLKHSKGQLMS